MRKYLQYYLRAIGSKGERLPVPIARALSKLSFKISSRPYTASSPEPKQFGKIEVTPFKYGSNGALCLSADFEMSWAWRFAKNKPQEDLGKRERENVPKIVHLLDEYSIPITWATVGHLFLDRCQRGGNGLGHPDMYRPSHFRNKEWVFDQGDWYQHDPCSDYKKSPKWYAPDLIQMIKDAKVSHEIGTHTFSHIDFSDHNCPHELAESEIQKCIEVMEPFGLKPKSIVFPGGTSGNYDTLKKFGIVAMRGKQPDQRAELSYPQNMGDSLWNIPSSLVIEKRKHWDNAYAVWRVNKYIERAIEHKSLCHLWFHPSLGPEIIKEVFPHILSYADREKKTGNLWVATMNEIADYCQARASTQVSFRENGSEVVLEVIPDRVNYDWNSTDLTLRFTYPITKSIREIRKDGQRLPYSRQKDLDSGVNIATFNTKVEPGQIKINLS